MDGGREEVREGMWVVFERRSDEHKKADGEERMIESVVE